MSNIRGTIKGNLNKIHQLVLKNGRLQLKYVNYISNKIFLKKSISFFFLANYGIRIITPKQCLALSKIYPKKFRHGCFDWSSNLLLSTSSSRTNWKRVDLSIRIFRLYVCATFFPTKFGSKEKANVALKIYFQALVADT